MKCGFNRNRSWLQQNESSCHQQEGVLLWTHGTLNDVVQNKTPFSAVPTTVKYLISLGEGGRLEGKGGGAGERVGVADSHDPFSF